MKTISQSLIRDMLKPEGYCGHYLNEVHNNGFRIDPTDAMMNGLVFEQAILGSTRDGEKVELPKLKTGKPSQRQKDLWHAINFAERIIAENDIAFTVVQKRFEMDNRHGHVDAIGTYRGVGYIFDLKFTAMTWTTYERDLKFSERSGHHLLQARHYQTLVAQLPFMLLVFGKGWARFFDLPYDTASVEHHKEIATEALETFNALDYRATSDSRLCFECPMGDVCKVRNNTITVEQF